MEYLEYGKLPQVEKFPLFLLNPSLAGEYFDIPDI